MLVLCQSVVVSGCVSVSLSVCLSDCVCVCLALGVCVSLSLLFVCAVVGWELLSLASWRLGKGSVERPRPSERSPCARPLGQTPGRCLWARPLGQAAARPQGQPKKVQKKHGLIFKKREKHETLCFFEP